MIDQASPDENAEVMGIPGPAGVFGPHAVPDDTPGIPGPMADPLLMSDIKPEIGVCIS